MSRTRSDTESASDRLDEGEAVDALHPMDATESVPHRPSSSFQGSRQYRAIVISGLRKYGLLIAWVLLALFFVAVRPNAFLSPTIFTTILGSQAVLVILSLSLIFPFAAGEFDLSIAGVMGLALVMIGDLNVLHNVPIGWAVAAAFGMAIVVGLINAFFVVIVGIDSIVTTLGMGTLLTGLSYGLDVQETGGISDQLGNLVRTDFLGLPLGFYYGLGLTVVAWYVFTYTPLGRYLYFVGAGREVARLSGLPVDLIRAGTLLTSAVISGIAGIVLAGWLGGSSPSVAGPYLLPAFAGIFLGATAITPGRFNPWGTFIAVYFLITGVVGLEIMGLVGWVEQVFYGASLILAVTFSHAAGVRKAV